MKPKRRHSARNVKDAVYHIFDTYQDSYNRAVNDALKLSYYNKEHYSIYIPDNTLDYMYKNFNNTGPRIGVNVCKTSDLQGGDYEVFRTGGCGG